MRIVFFILFFLASNLAQSTDELAVSCVGTPNANHALIYLHGIDSLQPSQQEILNRTMIERIANSLNIRIALPRAAHKCSHQPNSICWGWKFDESEIASILPLIISSRIKCFSGSKPFGVLGFSNGGYLITGWYRQTLKPIISALPSFFIVSGSERGFVAESANLASNPPLSLIIGKNDDYNRDPNSDFFLQLKNAGAKVERVQFDGGHRLDENSLLRTLKRYLIK